MHPKIKHNLKTVKSKITSLSANKNVRSIFWISGLYFFSRILGFFRTVILGQQLDKISQELILNADKIPTYISTILLMGTVYSSVFPVFSRLNKGQDNNGLESKIKNTSTSSLVDKSKVYFDLMVVILTIGVAIVTVFGMIFTPWILENIFTSGENWQKAVNLGLIDQYVLASRILLLTPINFCIQALYGVILNFNKKFVVFSLAGILANVFSIIGIFFSRGSFVNFAIGTTVGVTLSSVVYIWKCNSMGYKFNFEVLNNFIQNLKNQSLEIKQTFRVFWPRIFLIDGFFVAYLLLGKFTTLDYTNYAFDLATSVQNTFYILISSLGIIALPALSESSSGSGEFWTKIKTYLKNSFLLGFFVAICCMVFAPLVLWLFELFGKINSNVNYIILLIQIGSIKLVFNSIKEILNSYFYAIESKFRPVLVSVTANVGQVAIFFLLLNQKIDVGISAILCMSSYYVIWAILGLLLVRKDYGLYVGKSG